MRLTDLYLQCVVVCLSITPLESQQFENQISNETASLLSVALVDFYFFSSFFSLKFASVRIVKLLLFFVFKLSTDFLF